MGESYEKALKLFLPCKEYPGQNFVGLIIGPRGATIKLIEAETGVKMAIRGKPSPAPQEEEPLHVQFRGRDERSLERACKRIRELLPFAEPSTFIEVREDIERPTPSPSRHLGRMLIPVTRSLTCSGLEADDGDNSK
jgi:hypothetical protein